MITEIVNFIESLPQEVFSWGEYAQKGLYIELSLDGKGRIVEEEPPEIELLTAKKDEELSDLLQRCFHRQVLSKHMFGANRSFDSTNKIFIYTASPFAFGFKKKSIKEKEWSRIKAGIDNYFKRAKELIDSNNEMQLDWANRFELFCREELFDWINTVQEYKELGDNLVTWIYLRGPSVEDFKIIHDRYLECMVLLGNEDSGISDALSKFPSKKMFMSHQSAPFVENRKITRREGLFVWQFFELKRRKVFPNPLPVFIDQRELNNTVIKLYNREGTLSWSELIRRIFEDHSKDLSNYYLFFFVGNEIADLDFVPSFQYYLRDMYISQFFRTSYTSEVEKTPQKIDNIFDFEKDVANVIFNGQLVRENWLRYFGDIDSKYMSDATYVLMMKYRKAFYDYIYKSRRQAISSTMFHDIMWQTIHELIHLDEDMKNDYRIRERLDIWFGLYHYFDSSNQNSIDMVNKSREILEHLQKAIEVDEPILRNDDDFAFAAGQLIRYLLQQSKSAQRTHALLEPFLQKVQPKQFKQALAKTFDTYKHEITLYSGENRYPFDKLMSEVLGYEPNSANMKELMPMVLAGYFARSVLFSKKQQETVENHND